jgi:hypothetical protein
LLFIGVGTAWWKGWRPAPGLRQFRAWRTLQLPEAAPPSGTPAPAAIALPLPPPPPTVPAAQPLPAAPASAAPAAGRRDRRETSEGDPEKRHDARPLRGYVWSAREQRLVPATEDSAPPTPDLAAPSTPTPTPSTPTPPAAGTGTLRGSPAIEPPPVVPPPVERPVPVQQ